MTRRLISRTHIGWFVPLFFLYVNAGSADVLHLTGAEASALVLAEREFLVNKYSSSGNLKHFTVQIERQKHEVHVTFLPDEPKLGPNEAGTGGGNAYGLEVHYSVSLNPLKIVKVEFAR